MNAERLTSKSRDVITGAVADAGRRGHATVEPWHMLLSLLDQGGSTPPALLRAAGANPAALSPSHEFATAIGEAELIATPLGDEYVSTEHLLAGLARVGGPVGRALKDARATKGALVAGDPPARGGEPRRC